MSTLSRQLEEFSAYLKGSVDITLKYRSVAFTERFIHCYVDASYANDPIDQRSHGGALVYYGKHLVAHYSKVQAIAVTSTFESECIEMVRACRVIITVVNLLQEITDEFKFPVLVFSDAASVLATVKDITMKGRSRHYCSKITMLRGCSVVCASLKTFFAK